ncbi:phage tail protein [Desulfovibrio sp. OttesenSCG-928-G11]|nr:phage tail protein [Desulfovibrio sp. OttesenSCG-928-G11]
MALKIEVSDSDRTIKSMLATIEHIKDGAPKACARAINATLAGLRKEAIRLAQGTYTAKARDLARKALLQRAKAGQLSGLLSIKDKRGLNLVNFQAKPNRPGGKKPKEGASVKVLKAGSRKNPRKSGQKAFVARGGNGNVLMFVRLKKGRGGLQALYGPHPVQSLGRDDNQDALNRTVERLLPQNLQKEVDAVLAASLKGKR